MDGYFNYSSPCHRNVHCHSRKRVARETRERGQRTCSQMDLPKTTEEGALNRLTSSFPSVGNPPLPLGSSVRAPGDTFYDGASCSNTGRSDTSVAKATNQSTN